MAPSPPVPLFSVVDFPAGARFFLRLYMNMVVNPDRSWSNTFELVAGASGGLGDLQAAIIDFSRFLQQLLLTSSQVKKATVGTWEVDGVPYDPTSFYTANIANALGVRGGVGEAVNLENAAYLTKNVLAGRSGRAMVRGSLGESDVSSPAGVPVFTSPSGYATTLANAVTFSGMPRYFLNGGAVVNLCTITKPGNSTRRVTGFTAQTVVNLDLGRGWYNQDAGTPSETLEVPEEPSELEYSPVVFRLPGEPVSYGDLVTPL